MDRDKLKQAIFLIALFALGGFLFWSLSGFMSASLGAVVFYIIFRKLFFHLTEHRRKPWNKQLTIVMLLFISFIVLILPLFLVTLLLSSKIAYVIAHYEELLQVLQQWSERASAYIGIDVLSKESVGKLTGVAANIAPRLLSATANAIVDIFVLYFMLYFMLANARKLEISVRNFLPFKPQNNQLLVHELRKQTIANSIGIPSLALITGMVATLGYWVFGIGNPLLWGTLTGIATVVPAIGVGLIWIPIVVYLFLSSHPWHGFGLLLYCLLVFTVVENGFRIIVLKKLGDTHPLVTFFGVLVGLEIFGFVGIIFGPLLISYFILLVKIYRNEYMFDAY